MAITTCSSLNGRRPATSVAGIRVGSDGQRWVAATAKDDRGEEVTVEKRKYDEDRIHLAIECEFEGSKDLARFYYSADGAQWNEIGTPLRMKYTLDHFMGYRFGLYNYATEQAGGYADFDYFRTSVLQNKTC
jgi:beta-xylosidase